LPPSTRTRSMSEIDLSTSTSFETPPRTPRV
jgi:hypothetical protein